MRPAGRALWTGAAGTVAAWIGAVLCVASVLWRIGDGWDLTDESFYLLSAAPPRHDDAFNGFSGLYLRLLWRLAGWNVAVVRTLGVVVLVAVAALLGWSLARLLRARAGLLVAFTVAAGTAFYASTDRTPGYNWLALVGATLVSAAVLQVISGRCPLPWAVIAGLGILVAAIGKPTTAVLMTLAAAVVLRRLRPLAALVAVLAAGAVVHLLLVLPLPQTLGALRRSAAMVAVLDPRHYTLAGAATTALVAVVVSVLIGLGLGGALGLLPVVARIHPRRERCFVALSILAVALAGADALASRAWAGGWPIDARNGPGPVPVLLAVLTAGLAGRVLRLPAAATPGAGAGCAFLLVAAVSTLVGTGISLGAQLTITGVLLAGATLLACSVLPTVAVRPVTVAVLVTLCTGTLVVDLQTVTRAKQARLAESTVPVVLGPATVHLDADTAARIGATVNRATAAGWRQGMPLIDTTYTPALPLALRADVPPVLLPALAQTPADPVCQAVRGLGPRWGSAWLLVRTDWKDEDEYLRRLTGYLGRSPRDYDRVATFENTALELPIALLRPRPTTGSPTTGSPGLGSPCW